jgi:hypothetical protein
LNVDLNRTGAVVGKGNPNFQDAATLS